MHSSFYMQCTFDRVSENNLNNRKLVSNYRRRLLSSHTCDARLTTLNLTFAGWKSEVQAKEMRQDPVCGQAVERRRRRMLSVVSGRRSVDGGDDVVINQLFFVKGSGQEETPARGSQPQPPATPEPTRSLESESKRRTIGQVI